MRPAIDSRRLSRYALVLALSCGSCFRSSRAATSNAATTTPAAPTEIPEIDLPQLKQLLDSLRGKVVVVNAWASWCVPCVQEFAELDAFARDYRDRDIQVLAISVDDPASRESAVVPFVAARKPGFRVLLRAAGPDAPFRELLDPGWDGTIPATFVFDREGRLKTALIGGRKREEFEHAVAPLVGSPHPRSGS